MDLGSVVTGVVEAIGTLVERKRQTLTFRMAPAPLRILGDATRLSQIVLDLLMNAHKYTPAGGHIWIELDRDSRLAQLRVIDGSISMSPELLPRIFDLFAEVDRDLQRAESGLSIGLTLVQKLVQLHGGTVTASSGGPGRGSEFLVRFPAMPEERTDANTATGAAAAPASAARRVLVVDDSPAAADSLALLLQL